MNRVALLHQMMEVASRLLGVVCGVRQDRSLQVRLHVIQARRELVHLLVRRLHGPLQRLDGSEEAPARAAVEEALEATAGRGNAHLTGSGSNRANLNNTSLCRRVASLARGSPTDGSGLTWRGFLAAALGHFAVGAECFLSLAPPSRGSGVGRRAHGVAARRMRHWPRGRLHGDCMHGFGGLRGHRLLDDIQEPAMARKLRLHLSEARHLDLHQPVDSRHLQLHRRRHRCWRRSGLRGQCRCNIHHRQPALRHSGHWRCAMALRRRRLRARGRVWGAGCRQCPSRVAGRPGRCRRSRCRGGGGTDQASKACCQFGRRTRDDLLNDGLHGACHLLWQGSLDHVQSLALSFDQRLQLCQAWHLYLQRLRRPRHLDAHRGPRQRRQHRRAGGRRGRRVGGHRRGPHPRGAAGRRRRRRCGCRRRRHERCGLFWERGLHDLEQLLVAFELCLEICEPRHFHRHWPLNSRHHDLHGHLMPFVLGRPGRASARSCGRCRRRRSRRGIRQPRRKGVPSNGGSNDRALALLPYCSTCSRARGGGGRPRQASVVAAQGAQQALDGGEPAVAALERRRHRR
mmetsp:Transcript_123147/g.394388  ORF Transcript_123147/g.394388 Transcript_123147/m.394388 type:complete len:571 (+) Transcript_123147:650-2362(+)